MHFHDRGPTARFLRSSKMTSSAPSAASAFRPDISSQSPAYASPSVLFARFSVSGYVSGMSRLRAEAEGAAISMTDKMRWQRTMILVILIVLVWTLQTGLLAQNLGTAPQVGVAVQGQQGTQPEG